MIVLLKSLMGEKKIKKIKKTKPPEIKNIFISPLAILIAPTQAGLAVRMLIRYDRWIF